jgi:Sterol carrier protein domain
VLGEGRAAGNRPRHRRRPAGQPAGRGFPAGARVTARLAVADAQLPANAGDWLLTVAGGKGELSRAETGSAAALQPQAALPLGARGLAALYAGTPLSTLRRGGLVAGGDPAADAALDEAFGCTPYMLAYF